MSSFTKFTPGEYVVVQGLEKTPEMNGKVGEVKVILEDKQRVTVRLIDGLRSINAKDGNLKQASELEIKTQLKEGYDKLTTKAIFKLLKENNLLSGGNNEMDEASREKFLKIALEKKIFPQEVVEKKQRSDLDEVIDVPGLGQMSRREMREKADQLEKLTPSQMRDQIRVLSSSDRRAHPQLRDMSETDIKSQIAQFEQYLAHPSLKKQHIEAFRSGNFSKVNSLATMDDDAIRNEAKKKLEMFQKDPTEFRRQFLADQPGLSDEDIVDSLTQQATADSATLQEMRKAASGNLNAGDVNLSNISDEQLRKNTVLQVKMFKENPQKIRKQLEARNPMVKEMTNDQLLQQLEMMASMDPKDIRSMQTAGTSSTSGGKPDLDNMTGQQLSAMFKMQRDMFKRDPKQFRQMVPQMAALSDANIQQQLDTMAEMDPEYLKTYMGMTSQFAPMFNRIREPLDKISGGRGTQILGFLALFLLGIFLWYTLWAVYRILGYFFPTTFGPFSGGSSQTASAAAGTAATTATVVREQIPIQQVDLNVEEDGFFQEDL